MEITTTPRAGIASTFICTSCGLRKSREDFQPDKTRKNGIKTYKCKKCRNHDHREYLKKNPEVREKQLEGRRRWGKEHGAKWRKENRAKDPAKAVYNDRKYWLKKAYGITPEQYDGILEAQNYGCAICGRQDSGEGNRKYLVVDHCHDSGNVRGLLCGLCNKAIGLLNDDYELVVKAASYLERNKNVGC